MKLNLLNFLQRKMKQTLKLKNKKGFGLIEVLVASSILLIVSLGLVKVFDISFSSANLTHTIIADQDLKVALGTVLASGGQCGKNLDPSKLTLVTGTDIYTVSRLNKYRNPTDAIGTEIIGISNPSANPPKFFKDFLNIVKIEFEELDNNDTLDNYKNRRLAVFFKRRRVKNHLKTKNGDPCTSANTYDNPGGCYFNTCNIEYEVVGTSVTTCNLLDCFSNVGSVSSAVNCYTVEDSTGDKKTLVGCGSTQSINAHSTVAFGYNAGKAGLGATYNTFIGYEAGKETQDQKNTFVGYQAGTFNTTGGNNSFFGQLAGKSNTTGLQNSFFGSSAGQDNTTGFFNSFFGYQAGVSNTTGEQNNFFGYQAGQSNTTGSYNSFFGSFAGQNNTGINNTFIGHNAGQANTTGAHNTFIGVGAGSGNTDKSYNTFIGWGAGSNNKAEHNTFVGYVAGGFNDTGKENTFIGYFTGRENKKGNYNIYIGTGVGPCDSTKTHCTSNGVAGITEDGHQQLSIGNLILGRLDDPTGFPQAAAGRTSIPASRGVVIHGSLHVDGAFSHSSDRRFKKNLNPLSPEQSLNLLNKMKPYSFEWKDKSNEVGQQMGFIAQDIKSVSPELVSEDQNGLLSLKYFQIIPLLVSGFQAFQKSVKANFLTVKKDIELTHQLVKSFKDSLITMKELIKSFSKKLNKLDRDFTQFQRSENKNLLILIKKNEELEKKLESITKELREVKTELQTVKELSTLKEENAKLRTDLQDGS